MSILWWALILGAAAIALAVISLKTFLSGLDEEDDHD